MTRPGGLRRDRTATVPGARPRLALVLSGYLVVLAASLWWPVPARAHESLAWSDPPGGGVLRQLPSRAVLAFTGDVVDVHDITVHGPGGSVVNGVPSVSGHEVRQNLWAGPDGMYVLSYDVESTDGHHVSGEVQFQVNAPGVESDPGAGEDRVSRRTPGSDSAARWWEQRRVVASAAAVMVVTAAGALRILRRRRSAAAPNPGDG